MRKTCRIGLFIETAGLFWKKLAGWVKNRVVSMSRNPTVYSYTSVLVYKDTHVQTSVHTCEVKPHKDICQMSDALVSDALVSDALVSDAFVWFHKVFYSGARVGVC